MSRIGKLPVGLPVGVSVEVDKSNLVTIKGKFDGKPYELHQKVHPDIAIKVENNQVVLERPTEQKRHKALHGLYRSLISNMVVGLSTGYSVQQELVGVGYRASVKGQRLELALGYSHMIVIELPPEIKIEAKAEKRGNPILTIQSPDKQLLGQVAAKIRSLRPPEPYKGKGIKFVGEELRRKAGKSASK